MERVLAMCTKRKWLLSAGLLALAACSSDSGASSQADAGTVDTGAPDTGTDASNDTAVSDSGAADSGSPDGVSLDSGSDGSGGSDTGPRLPNGSPCSNDDACLSGLCVGVPGVAGQSVCAVVCLTDADCGEGLDCVPVTTGSDALAACLPVETCLDADGDGFGLGAACIGVDCDDTRGTVNPRGEELCDGIDNDCDGLVDDRPSDAGRACETGFAGGCSAGVTVCEANALLCQPNLLPSEEVCDGLDNDCDGAADEDEAGSPLSRGCYDGPTGTEGLGLCTGGRQVCVAGDFGGCLGQVLPGAEICDDLDNDCDGLPDDETTEVNWYLDADGDGFGTAEAAPVFSCVRPDGYVLNSDDCDDTLATANPLGEEVAGDGIDQNCDGSEDCFVDLDADGYASTSVVRSLDTDCADPGEVDATVPGGDCDDADGQTYPGAFEIVGDEADNDCNGTEVCFADADGDGVRTTDEVPSDNVVCTDAGEGRLTGPSGDCEDRDPAIRPGQSETCNGVDDDCNGAIDDRLTFRRYYLDRDADGYGAAGTTPTSSCSVLDGFVENDLDCADEDPAVRPGAEEQTGDGLDQNCDGRELCFVDADNDGFRTIFSLPSEDADCNDSGEAVSGDPATDCNDNSASVRPTATEIAGDGVDQNCDGGEICFVDADADGYRLATTVVSADAACDGPGESRVTAPTGDCNDGDSTVRPGATEICNGVDDDCDSAVDDGLATVDYYVDADADGFGDATGAAVADCRTVAGSVANNRDCNDRDSAISPSATEVAGDSVDQNCDGRELCFVDADNDAYRGGDSVALSDDVDCADDGEAAAGEPLGDCNDSMTDISPLATELPADGVDQNCDGLETCFADGDGDGFRPDAESVVASSNLGCADAGEATGTVPVGDCDDADRARNPASLELCDLVDNNCNGLVDDAIATQDYYPDADADGFGDGSATAVTSCAAVSGRVANALDCDDRNATIYTGAAELPGDGVDQNCDNQELCFTNADGDGYRTAATRLSATLSCSAAGEASAAVPSGDCNDSAPTVFPGAVEIAGDQLDQNCDGKELCFVDADNDGFRTASTVLSSRVDCNGAGEALVSQPAGDCDDASSLRYPGAAETCNELDDDCDGLTDEGLTTQSYFADADGDGFGSAAAEGLTACRAVAGSVTNNADCDDTNAAIRPGVGETAGDGVDANCDGSEVCFEDSDGDGYRPGAGAAVVVSSDADCADAGEALSTALTGDCDDGSATVRPGVAEVAGDGVDQNCDGSEVCFLDGDGDGYRPNTTDTVASTDLLCTGVGEAGTAVPVGDCADSDPTRNPGAQELCDSLDQDCDGLVDESVATQNYYPDVDGDLRGDARGTPVASCSDVAGRVANALDCNDLDANVYGGATEVVGDGVDQDCDSKERCFVDADSDGFRSENTQLSSDLTCTSPLLASRSVPEGDCNDLDDRIRPTAAELAGDGVDQNCDGQELCFVNADGDGFRTSSTSSSSVLSCNVSGLASSAVPSGDCDDTSALRYPGATEFCDGVDQDCDGIADNGLATTNYYADADADGFGSSVVAPIASCNAVTGRVTNSGDCNDSVAAIRPGVSEIAGDGADQNCDGQELCFVDADLDGYRNGAAVAVSADADCSDAGEATSATPDTDCNDANGAIRPGVTEIAGDSVDQNCDGTELCFTDSDGDGYRPTGGSSVFSPNLSCSDPGEAATSVPSGDCNDFDRTKNPGATEICDGVDQDCDGTADDGLATQSYFADADGDGRGSTSVPAIVSCAPVAGRVTNATDCNDFDETIYPGSIEGVADGVDQNCDALELCFQNNDGDTFRTTLTVASPILSCVGTGLARSTVLSGDCDDFDAAVYPGANEVAGDGVDQSCDGAELCYVNADNDPYRISSTISSTRIACNGSGEAPASRPAGDCDDSSSSRYPGATEFCNGIDEDCDDLVDEGLATQNYYPDADGDSFGAASGAAVASCSAVSGRVLSNTDCDDSNVAVRPGASEVPSDGVDQNCDGSEICFTDADDDGYRPNASSIVASSDLDCLDSGEALSTDPTTDCNDSVPTVRPGASEVVADGVDQNCDGTELCYADADNDGYRPNATATVVSANLVCTDAGERGGSAPTTDCNDLAATVYPGATEVIADGVDQNCDGGELCYLDNDNDGYRPNATATVASADLDCSDAREIRADAPTTDCNDNNSAVNPGVDVDADGINACLDCVDNDNRIPGGLITVTGSVASVEAGTNALPDLATRNFRAITNRGGIVGDVNVRLSLVHSWDGDLAISLFSPAGTQVSLSNRVGGSGDNFTNTVFDDEAGTAISAGTSPFTGSFRPSSPLNAVDSQAISGTWSLRVEDLASADTGSITSWSIDITTACP